MSKVVITKKNETYIRIAAEPSVLQELSDLFTFEVPNAQFSPKYKSRQWDGKIRLFHMMSGELYLGLLSHVYEYCKASGYEFVDNCDLIREVIPPEAWDDFVDSLSLHSNGVAIDVRDYQKDAAYIALTRARAILLSPTGSGKSLIMYLMVRWHQLWNSRQLILVPNTSLVEQMYGDFADYSSADPDWDADEQCVRIYSGQTKDYSKNVVISTWQSIYLKPKEFFQQFDVIYGDEAHTCAAKSLTGIFEKCTTVAHRVGTTGTLDGTKVHKLVLEGLFGPVYTVTTTKKLMDDKHLADLNIEGILLQYPAEQCKDVANHKKEYIQEVEFLITHPIRNRFICNLALATKGNTLLLFQYVEKHGKVLYDLINAQADEGRKVFFVHGGVDVEEREEVRNITEREQNAIVVASVGVFSQGINVPSLRNIIFAAPTKSRIRNLQAIGRGLRRTDEKIQCTLYDIGDDLSWKSRQNYALQHFIERIKLYAEENFTYAIRPVSIVE